MNDKLLYHDVFVYRAAQKHIKPKYEMPTGSLIELLIMNSTLFSKILPTTVRCVEQIGILNGLLLPEESSLLAESMVEKRLVELSAGRTCAREALELFNLPKLPIMRGSKGEPIWPSGFAGSITHCEGYCAAAVARTQDYSSLGIDAEINKPLPPGVLDLIATPPEKLWLQTMASDFINWSRLLFSIKESIYKAWYPKVGRWLEFQHANVKINDQSRTFRAELHPSANLNLGEPLEFEGTFLVTPSLLLSCVCLSKDFA
jgi:4'-phosphopantetheinyl transferase EntD